MKETVGREESDFDICAKEEPLLGNREDLLCTRLDSIPLRIVECLNLPKNDEHHNSAVIVPSPTRTGKRKGHTKCDYRPGVECNVNPIEVAKS